MSAKAGKVFAAGRAFFVGAAILATVACGTEPFDTSARMVITPDPIALTAAEPGDRVVATVRVSNEAPTGDLDAGDLEITGFKIYDGADVFSVAQMPAFPLLLAPGASFDFEIAFAAGEEGEWLGAIVFDADSMSNHDERVEIVGVVDVLAPAPEVEPETDPELALPDAPGAEAPPVDHGGFDSAPVVDLAPDSMVAVASCVVQGSDAPAGSELSVIPLDTIVCTAGASTANRTIVEYRWTVDLQPPGSTTRFDTPNAERSHLFVDLAGEYEFGLEIVDEAGRVARAESPVKLQATPSEDIHVELTWETSGDADQTDSSGSDVDLHMLRSGGCWEDTVADIHFRSTSPNWGDGTRDDDNPSLDIDDVDGAGPENINLDNPADGLLYIVGVHYWNDWGFGESTATVRIYLDGILSYAASRELRNGEFWEVASIDWELAAVDAINGFYTDIDSAPCR